MELNRIFMLFQEDMIKKNCHHGNRHRFEVTITLKSLDFIFHQRGVLIVIILTYFSVYSMFTMIFHDSYHPFKKLFP